MSILEIYEKVTLVTPIEQRRFFSYLDDSVAEIESTFGRFIFEPGATYSPPTSLEDDFAVLPLYHGAIVDNILFLSTQSEMFKSESMRKAKEAYLKYWRDGAKGKKVKKARW